MDTTEAPLDKADILLELNFVPTWARRPPGINPYASEGEETPRRQREHTRTPRPERRPAGQGKFSAKKHPREKAPVGRYPQRQERPAAELRDLPLNVSFIPEQTHLSALVRQLHTSARAYPLADIAELFLANPSYYLIKLEVSKNSATAGEKSTKLYQCSLCKAVFLEKNTVIEHAMTAHLEDFFTREDTVGEPPAGSFTCIGRCKISGVLLGPPNHHGFNERIQELHRTRFSHLTLDEYRSQIETIRDPALIDQWKEEARKKTVYRRRDSDPTLAPIDLNQARDLFLKEHSTKLVIESERAIIPATIARQIPDGPLKRKMRESWSRESRHPSSLSLALRLAFRHMGFHLFRAGRGTTFITNIHPHPINLQHTIAPIREVLEFLSTNPGCTRQKLIEILRPGLAATSVEVIELINHLRWLIEKGHVIEFFNGTLSVPSAMLKKPHSPTEAQSDQRASQPVLQ